MTVTEQLTAWAADPDSEILVSFSYDDIPCWIGRIKARDFVAQFDKRIADAEIAKVDTIKGVTCVLIEGHTPNAPHSHYRTVLSAPGPFT